MRVYIRLDVYVYYIWDISNKWSCLRRRIRDKFLKSIYSYTLILIYYYVYYKTWQIKLAEIKNVYKAIMWKLYKEESQEIKNVWES